MQYLRICLWIVVRLLPVIIAFAAGFLYADDNNWQPIFLTIVAIVVVFWITVVFSKSGEALGIASIPLIDAGFTKERH